MNEENNALVEVNREFLPIGNESANLMDWIKILSEAPYYKKIGIPGMMAMVLTGRELGMGTMASLNGALHDIQGKIAMSAEQMRAKFRTAGHSLLVVSLTEELCTLKGTRRDNKDFFEYTFTMADATRGGVTGNPNWKKSPKDMLMASCTRKIIRFLAPELLCGTGIDEGEFETIEITPPAPEPMDRETALFIDDFELLDKDSNASQFIDGVAATLEQGRKLTIIQAAKDPETFRKKLKRYMEKKTAAILEKTIPLPPSTEQK